MIPFNTDEITSRPLLTKDQYINQKRQEIINQSIKNSRNRTLPTVPYIVIESEKQWHDRIATEIRDLEKLINDPADWVDENTLNSYRERLNTYRKKLDEGYEKNKWCEGDSCIYTATDNYGKKYRISGNQSFRANPNKYGFEEISLNELAPGDIVQDFSSRDNMPHHAITFVGYDENGKALFNYSKGGSTEEAIVTNGHYPFEWDDENPRVHLDGVNNDKLKHSAAAYRFIGTEEDNAKWNNDYYDYRRAYDKDWFEEAKRVKNILPTILLAPSPTIITSPTIKSDGGILKNLNKNTSKLLGI